MLHFLKKLIPQSVKNVFYHLPVAVCAAFWYGFPGRRLMVVGVTGTDGKTTTAHMLTHILERSGKKVSLASTIAFRSGGESQVNATKYTTLSAFFVQKFLRDAVRSGVTYVVLEVSSHALDQYRLWGVPFVVGAITNVTREHLDYHQTMGAYRRSKRRLLERSLCVVVNGGMENPQEFWTATMHGSEKSVYGFSDEKDFSDAAIRAIASSVVLDLSGSRFVVSGVDFRLSLLGRFNIENALCSVSCARFLGVSFEESAQALSSFAPLPGRMEFVPNDRGLSIVVDYAVTPHSLVLLYDLLHDLRRGAGRVIAVFGACGDRDRGKRPEMGRVVSERADVVVLTDEDPYFENPKRILNDIAKGITGRREMVDFFRIMDRREAIAKALLLARTGDIVVVTGKGAEETMAVRDDRLPWNDRQVIEEELKKLN
ncbi:MAG: UDP-N-acetylmuramoyl-L-alanyl-D-glutamate--2,6-diaminopimelate ligase [Candidatus Moranbacteria bacterium]|nr:UDP-N-acetylmuramoyl-L-alanyl-D-glutamate--2,6-diaminopimelate ligase [Candidatus Moranbacteria bacterium]